MDRPQKRLVDKLSHFLQRRWWKKSNRNSNESIQETLPTAVPHFVLPHVSRELGPIRKQDPAVSVSSANKAAPTVDVTLAIANADSMIPATTSISSAVQLSSSYKNLPVPPTKSDSIRRRVTLKGPSQPTKTTFRRQVPIQSDVVFELLHAVDSMKLKNKSSVGRSRTLLRSRRLGSKRHSSQIKKAFEVAAKLNECSFRSIGVSEIKDLRQYLQNSDRQ